MEKKGYKTERKHGKRWEAVDWAGNASMYEINIRQYTPEGTFNAFISHLPRLKELGINILWFMPITPISRKNKKGTLGSYYAVQNYRQVNPDYGTLEDFKNLVKQAHGKGFKVILDWVANHTGWDNPLIEEHPDWYIQKEGEIVSPVEDWSDVAGLDYNNRDLRDYMIESLLFWVRETEIDGYRCDMAALVPVDFWEEAREALEKVKPVFMLAEAWEPLLTEKAFDACYGWDLHHLMNDIAQHKKDGTALPGYFHKVETLYSRSTIILNFIDNHDENSWQGYITERLGEAFRVYAVLMYTVPGMPLVYTGQEVCLNKRLSFFEKDVVEWEENPELALFYRKLNELKHQNPALLTGNDPGCFHIIPHSNEKKIFVFERYKAENHIIVVLNFSAENQQLHLESVLSGSFLEYFENEKTENLHHLILSPFAYKVYVKQFSPYAF